MGGVLAELLLFYGGCFSKSDALYGDFQNPNKAKSPGYTEAYSS